MNELIAKDVMHAAKQTFEMANNDERYAIGKTNSFLKRCGAKLEDGPNQKISKENVDRVCFAMLDEDSTNTFWSFIKRC